MPNKVFTEEYDEVRQILQSDDFSTDKSAVAMLSTLKLLLGDDGPDKSHATALNSLRGHCKRGLFNKLFSTAKSKESDGILTLAGGDPDLNKKSAALKTLRHMRLLTKFGGHCLWIVSLPKPYSKWPIQEFDGLSEHSLKGKLESIDEYHSQKEMRDLSHATQKAVAWANKAGAMCSATNGVGATSGETLIKRWFADENNQSADKIALIRTTLVNGFGRIASAAGSGKMILTENPVDRGTEMEQSEAYVWYDRLNVIYIEGDFFGNQNLLQGMTNWARIIVHELSHSQLNTDDVETHGQPRYAWHPRGIGPRSDSFTTAQALNNADNWAWFAADASGALSKKNLNDALLRSGL